MGADRMVIRNQQSVAVDADAGILVPWSHVLKV